jgi:hypothetical protein
LRRTNIAVSRRRLVDAGIDFQGDKEFRAEANSDDRRRGKRLFGRRLRRSMHAARVACKLAGTVISATSVWQV